MTPPPAYQSDLDDPDRKIGTRELAALLNISLRTLYNRMANGGNKVPEPSSTGPRNKLEWVLSDVMAWMEVAYERQVFVGVVRRGYGWLPMVTRSARTWEGQARANMEDALGVAVRYFESTESRGAAQEIKGGARNVKPNKSRR